MIGYTEAPRAWGMTRGMARVLGVNLTDAVVEGWLTRRELAGLVDHCQRCDHVAECSDFLAHSVTAPSLPDFCDNKAGIEALAPRP
jgi:hypothetical protein